MAALPMDALGDTGMTLAPPQVAGATAAPDQALYSTKLHAPAVRSGVVPRARLLGRLCAASPGSLVLVAAAAGFGKTTLLAEWQAAETGRRAFGWLALDAGDNDPARFWGYVIETLRRTWAGFGLSAGDVRSGVAETVLPALVNEASRQSTPAVLVLDDYHAITSREIHEALSFLVERLPPGLVIALATRADPPLPLARLRVRERLLEVRAADLRFAADETGSLLNDRLGLNLSESDVARLHERTEGWPAGLYLAALSLRDAPDPARFVDGFAGDDRHVVDYLGEEVLDAQPDEVRSFLVGTALLDRISGPLCDAVLQREGSAGLLARLERSNLFLIPLDTRRQWYRFHHLFADLLRHEAARQLGPGEARDLQRRAALWHRDHGSAATAVEQFLAAGDHGGASEQVAGHWVRFFNAGELQTLTAWLDGLPAELVEADPRLCVARAWIALDLGRPQSAAPWVERAEAGPAGDPVLRLETAALRAVHRFKLGDVAAARAAAERAVRDADGAAGLWRTAALCVLGGAAAWQGHPGPARDALAAAVDVAEAMDNDLGGAYASGYLAFLAARDGDVAEAERHAEAALTRRAGAGFAGHFALAMAHTARGWALVDAGRHEEAAAAAGRGVELARGGASPVELSVSLLALARATAAGDRGQAEAERLLAEAWALVRACPDPGEVAQLLAAFERTALARREPPAAGDALTRQELAVLLLLAGDRTQREIGGELFVSVNTVKTHVKALYRKLDASTRAEAVARARAAGLVP